VLPLDKVEVFRRNLAAHEEPLVSWQAYTVKRSDKVESLAAGHGMSVAQLKEVNGVPAAKAIVAGQTLMVPVKGNAVPHLPDLPAPKLTPVRSAGKSKAATRPRMSIAKSGSTTAVRKPVLRAQNAKAKRTKVTLQPGKRVVVAEAQKGTLR
jgi:peptidoglycan lytic transglycosylase D